MKDVMTDHAIAPAPVPAGLAASESGPPTPGMRSRFRRLQAFADAIAYRDARTSAYCPVRIETMFY